MLPFQFGQFFRMIFGATALNESTPRRWVIRILFTLLFPLYELFNGLLLALDFVLFPKFKRLEARRPVFIIGNPRSGTTFLHRVMARDEENFTTTRLWQLIFPSLTAQYTIRLLGRLDRTLGSPISRALQGPQDRLLKGADKVHKLRLDAPEEDEGFFVHAFASGFLSLIFPGPKWRAYQQFDQMAEPRRTRLITFYRRCIQRHLYFDGQNRALLSKNPLFCTKIESLYRAFPQARFVYLVRNPAEALCSIRNMVYEIHKAQGMSIRAGESRRRPHLINFALDSYRHAMEVFDRAPQDSFIFVRYEDLVRAPRKMVERIYEKLEIPLTVAYQHVLDEEEARARAYRSEHEYALEQFDMTHREVEELAGFIYDRFGYARHTSPVSVGAV